LLSRNWVPFLGKFFVEIAQILSIIAKITIF
jgi:hypothetical protein